MLRRISAFFAAVAALVLLGSIVHSLRIQAAWSVAAGRAGGVPPAAIPWTDRLAWIAHDVAGLIAPFGMLASISLAVAFLIAGALARVTGRRTAIFGLAGGIAMFTAFRMMRLMLGTVGIFGARGVAGIALQMAVGVLAGLLFARLTRPLAPVR